MAPKTPNKSSKSQNSWVQCSLCNFVILKSSNEQHQCSKINDNQIYLFKNELCNILIVEHPKGKL